MLAAVPQPASATLPSVAPQERSDKECDFCGLKGDWKNVLKTPLLVKGDGSDIIPCDDCLNLYANDEWDKLIERVEAKGAKNAL